MSEKLQSVTVQQGVAICPVCERTVVIRLQPDRLASDQKCPHFRYAVQYERLYGVFAPDEFPSLRA